MTSFARRLSMVAAAGPRLAMGFAGLALCVVAWFGALLSSIGILRDQTRR